MITCPPSAVIVEFTKTQIIRATAVDAGGDTSVVCRDTAALPVGLHGVQCTATDEVGLTATCTAQVKVQGAL